MRFFFPLLIILISSCQTDSQVRKEFQQQIDSLDNQINQLNRNNDSLLWEIDGKEKELFGLMIKLDAARFDNVVKSDLDSQVRGLKEKLTQLRKQAQNLQTKNDSLQDRLKLVKQIALDGSNKDKELRDSLHYLTQKDNVIIRQVKVKGYRDKKGKYKETTKANDCDMIEAEIVLYRSTEVRPVKCRVNIKIYSISSDEFVTNSGEIYIHGEQTLVLQTYLQNKRIENGERKIEISVSNYDTVSTSFMLY